MNLLFDLKEILYNNKDNEHEMRITVDSYEIKVELIYDPSNSEEFGKEETVLTIVYDTCVEFAYIPDKEYREKYIVADYGIDKLEAKLVYDIMSYLELNGSEISEYCNMLSLHDGERYKAKVNTKDDSGV
jgi:hypothetical protein